MGRLASREITMNHKRVTLALISGLTFLATAGFAFASVEITHYNGSREELRQMCQKMRGDLRETNSKTRCTTLTGVTYICKSNGSCLKQTPVSTAFDASKNGGSLSSSGDIVAPKKEPKKL
jgi:hypothetical protein